MNLGPVTSELGATVESPFHAIMAYEDPISYTFHMVLDIPASAVVTSSPLPIAATHVTYSPNGHWSGDVSATPFVGEVWEANMPGIGFFLAVVTGAGRLWSAKLTAGAILVTDASNSNNFAFCDMEWTGSVTGDTAEGTYVLTGRIKPSAFMNLGSAYSPLFGATATFSVTTP